VSISSTIYTRLLRQYFCAKKLQSQGEDRAKLLKALWYQKLSNKMLIKSTVGRF